jgi:cytoskeletal protein CcmA (bactofilin family)
MFKRYSQNPFEQETSSGLFDTEKGNSTMQQAPRNPPQNSRTNTYQREGQQAPSYGPAPVQDEFSPEVPPRIYQGRVAQQRQDMAADGALTEDKAWEQKQPQPQQKPEPRTAPILETEIPETTLGEGVIFKGELRFERLLRIDGQFEGELKSDGKLIVGPKGIVKSNIKLRQAVIEGYVEGNLDVTERIELIGQAEVHGDIMTRCISVDEGVTINGNVMVSPEDKKLASLESAKLVAKSKEAVNV